MGHLASLSQRNINLRNNCNILLEDEIIKKISRGYDKKDIFSSLFNIIHTNKKLIESKLGYINTLIKYSK